MHSSMPCLSCKFGSLENGDMFRRTGNRISMGGVLLLCFSGIGSLNGSMVSLMPFLN